MTNFGIIGAGNIAGRFADSLSQLAETKLIAISARNKEKGQAFAEKFSVEFVYDNPQELLDNPKVDAVYVALPHGLHKEWSIRALKAKKSVICEKPAGLNAEEVREITACAKAEGCLYMEAMKPRFLPVYDKIREQISKGIIGEIKRVEACLCRDFKIPEDNKTYHTDPVMGGCLLDMGIYGASYLCDFLPGTPEIVDTDFRIKQDVDFYALGELAFDEGKTGRLECAFDEEKPESVVIIGERGTITVEKPSRPQRIEVRVNDGEAAGDASNNESVRIIEVPYEVDDFYSEIKHFVECVRKSELDTENRSSGISESELMPLDESVRCAEVISKIKNEAISR